MKPAILVIDNHDSFTYNLIQIVDNHGFPVKIVKNDAIVIKDLYRYENILISPGPGKPSEAGRLISMIKRFSASKHILGVCLGHQAIVEAFGGKLAKMKSVSHGIKKEIQVLKTDDYLFGGILPRFEAGLYHSWIVSKTDLPAELEITAVGPEGEVMAVSHKIFDLKGIQFHPESIMTGQGDKIISNWLDRSR